MTGDLRGFTSVHESPVTSEDWQRAEIVGTIPEGTERLVFGAFVPGVGAAEVDDFEVFVDDGSGERPLALENPSFDAGAIEGWRADSAGFDYTLSDGEDGPALRIARKMVSATPAFVRLPELGTTTEVSVGAGLRVAVPLVLLSEAGETLPRGDALALSDALDRVDCSDPAALPTRAASVAIAWNVHQHFHPYLDVVDVDWAERLPEAIGEALDAVDAAGQREVLERLTAQLRDGHVYVDGGPAPAGRLPLWLDHLDGQVVVRGSGAEGIEPGDVVLSVNGEEAGSLHAAALPRRSGSPQLLALSAMSGLTWGPKGETADVEVVGSSGEPRTVEVPYGARWRPEPEHPPVRTLDDGVMVVDLTRADWATLRPLRKALARAPGVVFDLRGYPTDAGSHLLPWLITEREERDWMFVAQRTHPDQAGPVEWQGFSWNLKPKRPHIEHTAWVTDARAISYAESVLGHVADLGLGPIVGRPTAGANGNVNPYTLPGGFTVSWTGMKVLNRDGSQHHLVGISAHPPPGADRGGDSGGSGRGAGAGAGARSRWAAMRRKEPFRARSSPRRPLGSAVEPASYIPSMGRFINVYKRRASPGVPVGPANCTRAATSPSSLL